MPDSGLCVMKTSDSDFTAVWGAYPNYDDIARFEYGRMMWRRPAMKARLVAHWTDPRHPHCERFAERRALLESVLGSTEPAALLDARLRESETSLRCVAREIPPVFGSFFPKIEPEAKEPRHKRHAER